MEQLYVKPIGKIKSYDGRMFVDIDKEYIPALKGLNGFSHLIVLWWFDKCDAEESRSISQVKEPYKNGPAIIGTFATRSPERPNPIAISTVEIIRVDDTTGSIRIAYIDANDGSPVIDLKPYTPSLDRVEMPGVPEWCCHWPGSLEESGKFDWENEFNF